MFLTEKEYELAKEWLLNKSGYFKEHPCIPIEQTWRGKKILIKCKNEEDIESVIDILDEETRQILNYAIEHEEEWNTAKEPLIYSIGLYGNTEYADIGISESIEKFIKRQT